MVSATTLQVTLKGLNSNRPYYVQGYISDVIGAKVLWNQNGVAASTSDNYFQISEPTRIQDISILTGPTVMTGFKLQSGGQDIPGSSVLIATQLSTIQSRTPPMIGFKANSLIGAVQF